jgi:hypothetical protein
MLQVHVNPGLSAHLLGYSNLIDDWIAVACQPPDFICFSAYISKSSMFSFFHFRLENTEKQLSNLKSQHQTVQEMNDSMQRSVNQLMKQLEG